MKINQDFGTTYVLVGLIIIACWLVFTFVIERLLQFEKTMCSNSTSCYEQLLLSVKDLRPFMRHACGQVLIIQIYTLNGHQVKYLDFKI